MVNHTTPATLVQPRVQATGIIYQSQRGRLVSIFVFPSVIRRHLTRHPLLHIRKRRFATDEAFFTHASDHDGCAVVRGVFTSVGLSIDAVHMARLVEGEAWVLTERQAFGDSPASRAPAGALGPRNRKPFGRIRWFSLVPRFTTGLFLVSLRLAKVNAFQKASDIRPLACGATVWNLVSTHDRAHLVDALNEFLEVFIFHGCGTPIMTWMNRRSRNGPVTSGASAWASPGPASSRE